MSEPPRSRFLEFVYLDLFERTSRGVLDVEAMRAVEDELLRNPEKGSIQAGTGECGRSEQPPGQVASVAVLASSTCTSR